MSQHDYNIINATGVAVRADLNSLADAIASNNSGATEPSTTFSYMWWADTTAGVMKQRNGANSAWITRGSLNSTGINDNATSTKVTITDAGVSVGSGFESTGIDDNATSTKVTITDTDISMGSGSASGGTNSTAMGNGTTASGVASTAIGNAVTASGASSVAIGRETTASGASSVAIGNQSVASGGQSIAMGNGTTASYPSSTAMGQGTLASGYYSTAMGYNTTAAAMAATAMGFRTTCTRMYSTIMGKNGGIGTNGGMALAIANAASSPGDISTATANTNLVFAVSDSGNVYLDGSTDSGSADYAEYFESFDGSPLERGYFVSFVDGSDCLEYGNANIVGIVSSSPAVVGDSQSMHYKGKYKKDEFDTYAKEPVKVYDEDGNYTHTEMDKVLSEDFDETQEYLPRSDRPEWSPVGLLGKLWVHLAAGEVVTTGDYITSDSGGKAIKCLRTDTDSFRVISVNTEYNLVRVFYK